MDTKTPRSFYTTPLPADRRCITVEATGIAALPARPERFRRESWRSWQMMYTLSGRGVGDIQGSELAAETDTIWLMPPDRDHGYQGAPSCPLWRYRWIEFSGQMVPDLLKMFRLTRRPCVHDCTPARPHVEALVTVLEARGNAGLHEATALLMRILAAMEQRAREADEPRGPSALLDEAAKAYMVRHLDAPITLSDLSRHVGVCPHHLIRVFRKRNATSPMQYLRQLRVNRAKRLLHEPRWNISEVGRAVGYDVLPHFSRMFKRITGLSPMQFRRSCAAATDAT
jgi:AraC-like DNA-binding protein